MGLDQRAYARKGVEEINLMVWRKHANLEGWMSEVFYSRGGEGEFNVTPLQLEEEDLLTLEGMLGELPNASRTFWGESTSEHEEQTEEFVGRALALLAKGYEIVYISSW